MAASNIKFVFALCLAACSFNCLLVKAQENENFLDIETPTVFNYNSPLKQPDSLRSRPYFDFLSTLYRHDTTKNDLFRPYLQRQRREAVEQPQQQQQAAIVPIPSLEAVAAAAVQAQPEVRRKRAILFRPLFVYKQQQVRRQEAARRRKRV